MKTSLTNTYNAGYACPVAGKIQQYGFESPIQVDNDHRCVFMGGFFVCYFAPFGRGSQEAFGLAAYLYAVSQPDYLALFAFESATRVNPHTGADPMCSPHPQANCSRPQDSLDDVSFKLAFLHDALTQPIAVNESFTLSEAGQIGLSLIIGEARQLLNVAAEAVCAKRSTIQPQEV